MSNQDTLPIQVMKKITVYLTARVLRGVSVFGRKNSSGSWWQDDKEGDRAGLLKSVSVEFIGHLRMV